MIPARTEMRCEMGTEERFDGTRDLDAAQARLGIRLETRVVPISTSGTRGYRLAVEITLPRQVGIVGKVEQTRESFGDVLRRLFTRGGRDGLDLATATFERAVALKPDEGSEAALELLFEDPDARQAALELIGLGCSLEILPGSLWATAGCLCHPPKLPDEGAVAARLVAVAAALLQGSVC